jgi:predicted exporter
LLASAYLFTQRESLWYPDLSALSTISKAESDLDSRMRADLSTSDARYMVVVSAPDREAVLRAAEKVGHHLDALVESNRIGGYDSPTRFLPSAATQEARRSALPPAETLRANLHAALAGTPLSAARLQPFLDDVETARTGPLLMREQLTGGLALAVDGMLLHNAQGWTALLPLRPAAEQAALPQAEIRQALAGSGALFIDMKHEFDQLYGDYLHEALWLSMAGLGGIIVLLAFTQRSVRRVGASLLPLLMSVVLVTAGLHLCGERLHLLHLIGMLLIVAIGSNYALFFDEQKILDGDTLQSMSVANLTTVIGFGTLALSSVPVLHAVGATVAPGTLLSLLLSAIFVPRNHDAAH